MNECGVGERIEMVSGTGDARRRSRRSRRDLSPHQWMSTLKLSRSYLSSLSGASQSMPIHLSFSSHSAVSSAIPYQRNLTAFLES
ncbi:uncharacterized protein LACBIDRAFT_298367 [Laccaria bicolor S238N-H82]|uniref:Predicted protein n=1 Tax=Laccaria bicolor (strain S238N-H82 / ATCC MYA-4686) TaxID=486041 RepID=B0E3D1_LACBS|nr:uncharacterized protein LACBIDRAFT_298367 [Laccaria bicolor S238N-H82]EDQ98652.1 predicted protein [Laccaria bicolor S238N-H82]|eukprot:XP_001890699.1 predicted protein [Laccaria bicolor S238N-H82]